ncbi:MAG: hypothetical protein R3C18_10790 [Planctomycetaceae bacterium]
MNATLWTYLAYLVLCVGITVWVGRTLRRQGFQLLTADRGGDHTLAEAFSQLLIVGFYLIVFGSISLLLKLTHHVRTAEEAFEIGSAKVGFVLLAIGMMHFFIVGILTINRRHDDQRIADEEYRATRAKNLASMEGVKFVD